MDKAKIYPFAIAVHILKGGLRRFIFVDDLFNYFTFLEEEIFGKFSKILYSDGATLFDSLQHVDIEILIDILIEMSRMDILKFAG